MGLVSRVEILDMAVGILYCVNALGKGINQSFQPQGKLDSLDFLQQSN